MIRNVVVEVLSENRILYAIVSKTSQFITSPPQDSCQTDETERKPFVHSHLHCTELCCLFLNFVGFACVSWISCSSALTEELLKCFSLLNLQYSTVYLRNIGQFQHVLCTSLNVRSCPGKIKDTFIEQEGCAIKLNCWY